MYESSSILDPVLGGKRANAVATAIELVISKLSEYMLKRILTIETLFLYVYDVVVYQTSCVAPCVTEISRHVTTHV